MHETFLHRRRVAAPAFALIGALACTIASAQTAVKPGFNVFSVQQDIEVGRQSAVEVERQLPMLNDRAVDSYVNQIVHALAQVVSGPKFPYQARVVNTSDINAFALPGGYLYVNRGLIEAATTEGELTSVIAHEMGHVALRHGTHQASKAYVTQAGLGILGGLLGRGSSRTTQDIVNAVGGFGLNALFLKYSRNDEYQADLVGAQTMAHAGYDPEEMARFFDTLRRQHDRDPGKLEQFFSSHPAPADRASRIRQEARSLTIQRSRPVGGFDGVRADLRGMPAVGTMAQVARAEVPTQRPGGSRTSVAGIAAPSSRLRTFSQQDGFFRIQYPDNWRVYEAQNGYGATIAPDGGIVDTGNGENGIVYGVIVNHYDPIDSSGNARVIRGNGTLESATNDLVAQVRRTNPHLSVLRNSTRRETIDGARALSVVLSGTSPVTGDEERVTVFTRELPDGHVIYALFIAPGRDYGQLNNMFSRMIQSLHVNDAVAHR